MLHSGRFANNSSSSRNSECGGPGKHPAPLSPPFPPPLQDHACVRDEAVHRDTRPELRPTSHKSRSLDCKICEHIATIKSASLVRSSPLSPSLPLRWHEKKKKTRWCSRARARVLVYVCVCACWRREVRRGGVCVLSCTSVVMATRSC